MNIRIHSFNVSCAGLCCALGSFLAADAREVHSLNLSLIHISEPTRRS